MKIDKDKLDSQIIRTKKLIVRATKTEDRNILGVIEEINKEICLVVANFKCQKCDSEEKLMLHHLITRDMRPFMDFWRYASQRHYWANQIILCDDCEQEIHNFNQCTKNKNETQFINKKTINKIKKKYSIKPKSAGLEGKKNE